MVKRLIGWGKIIPLDNAGAQSGGLKTDAVTETRGTVLNVSDDGDTVVAAASFACDVCGKVCGNKAALTSHKKTHNKLSY
jgi:hypothetical protein